MICPVQVCIRFLSQPHSAGQILRRGYRTNLPTVIIILPSAEKSITACYIRSQCLRHIYLKTPDLCPMGRLIFFIFTPCISSQSAGLLKLIFYLYICPNVFRDIRVREKSCISCQQSKIRRHVQSFLSQVPTENGRFSQVRLDFVRPLSSANDYRFLLTCIDCSTR